MTGHAAVSSSHVTVMLLLGVAPGPQFVAIVTQIALDLHKTCRLSSMTVRTFHKTGAGIISVPGVFRMHGFPGRCPLNMAERAGLDLRRPDMIAEFVERNHFGAVRRRSVVIVTRRAGRSIGLGLDPVRDQHLGIGVDHGVTAGQALLLHAFLNRYVEIAGHEHPHDHRRNDLSARMQGNIAAVALDRNDLRYTVKDLAVRFGHVVDAQRVRLDDLADIANI